MNTPFIECALDSLQGQSYLGIRFHMSCWIQFGSLSKRHGFRFLMIPLWTINIYVLTLVEVNNGRKEFHHCNVASVLFPDLLKAGEA